MKPVRDTNSEPGLSVVWGEGVAIHGLLAKRKSEGDAREGNPRNGSVSGGGGGHFLSQPLSHPLFFFFSPSCFSRASPAYIKGNENECYAGSQIYESKTYMRLTGRCYRLTSEIMQCCQHGDFWRENVIIREIHGYRKRQTSDSSWEFLRIENKQIKTVPNDSCG